VHEYIPVLSRPMALLGQHETTWSNVFIGHLDKELKIAVARPAFKTKSSLLAKTEVKFVRNAVARTTPTPLASADDEYYEYEGDYDEYYEEDEDYGEGGAQADQPRAKAVMNPEETVRFEELVEEALREQQV